MADHENEREPVYRLTARQLLRLAVDLQHTVLNDWLHTGGNPGLPGDRLLEYLAEHGITPEPGTEESIGG